MFRCRPPQPSSGRTSQIQKHFCYKESVFSCTHCSISRPHFQHLAHTYWCDRVWGLRYWVFQKVRPRMMIGTRRWESKGGTNDILQLMLSICTYLRSLLASSYLPVYRLSICPSVRLHGTSRLALDRFS